jgi:hypothetical protein
VERHDSVLLFKEALLSIVSSLETISEWHERKTASTASCLLSAVTGTDFIVALWCLADVLSLTVVLSKLLQSESMDLVMMHEHLNRVVCVLDEKMQCGEESFKPIWEGIETVMQKLGLTIIPCPEGLENKHIGKMSRYAPPWLLFVYHASCLT